MEEEEVEKQRGELEMYIKYTKAVWELIVSTYVSPDLSVVDGEEKNQTHALIKETFTGMSTAAILSQVFSYCVQSKYEWERKDCPFTGHKATEPLNPDKYITVNNMDDLQAAIDKMAALHKQGVITGIDLVTDDINPAHGHEENKKESD